MSFIDLKIGTSTVTRNVFKHADQDNKLERRLKKDAESTSANYGFKITGYKIYKDDSLAESFTKTPFKTYE